MTVYGKLNLGGMLALPAAATLAALFVFGPLPETLAWVFIINSVPMLLGGLFSALLLRGARRAGAGRSVALWPTLIPAFLGVVWYLFRAAVPETVAPGREYIAAPQYLLMGVLVLGVVSWVAGRVVRARAAAA